MISQELINWIIQEKEKGYTSEQLYESLVQNNYDSKEAIELLKIAFKSVDQSEEVIQPLKSKKKYVWKIILGLFLILVGYYIANSFDVSEKSIQNENLIIPPNIIPDKDNAFFELQRLSKEIEAEFSSRKTSTGKTFGGTALVFTASRGGRESLKDFFNEVKYAEIKEVYHGMEDFFPQIDTLIQIPQYQSPYYADIEALSFEELMNPKGISLTNFPHQIFSLVRLQKLRIMYLLLENENKLAIKTLTETLQFLQRTLSGNASLFEFRYYGISVPRVMLEQLDIFFQTKKLSYSDLLQVKKSTEYFQDTMSGLEKGFKCEYMFTDLVLLEMMRTFDDYSILRYSPYHLKKNKTRKYIADRFQNILDPTFEIRNDFDEYLHASNFILSIFIKENGYGHILASVGGTSTFDSYKKEQKESETYFRLFSVQVALQGYFEKHKQLPNSLQDLVPEFIDSLPSDPFGESFEYLPQENLLRSVGVTDRYEERIMYKIRTW